MNKTCTIDFAINITAPDGIRVPNYSLHKKFNTDGTYSDIIYSWTAHDEESAKKIAANPSLIKITIAEASVWAWQHPGKTVADQIASAAYGGNCGNNSNSNTSSYNQQTRTRNTQNSNTNQNAGSNDVFWDNDRPANTNSQNTQQQQQLDYVKKQYENTQQNLKNIQENTERLNNQATSLGNAVATSYYISQKKADAANNIYQNSSLDEKYSSIEELEQAYHAKLSAINQNVQEYKQAKESGLNNGYNYYMNNAQNSTEKSIGMLMYGIGTLVNSADAAKKERQAKEQLERERAAQIKRIEREKREQILAFRTDILAHFKDGGVPFYSHNLSTNEVYFFAYVFDNASITNDNVILKVSNVFPIAQYKDGTWLYKNDLIKQLNEKAVGNVTLIGYYTSKAEAERMRNSFLGIAPKSNMTVTIFEYKGTTAEPNSSNGNNTDFWDNKQSLNIKSKEPQPKKEQPKGGNSFWD